MLGKNAQSVPTFASLCLGSRVTLGSYETPIMFPSLAPGCLCETCSHAVIVYCGVCVVVLWSFLLCFNQWTVNLLQKDWNFTATFATHVIRVFWGILYTCPAGKGGVSAIVPPQLVPKFCVWSPSKLPDVFEKSTSGSVMLYRN